MSSDAARSRRAWVFGGSGAVGSAVVRELVRRGLECSFTFFENEGGARALHEATRARSLRFDAERCHGVEAWVDDTLRVTGFPGVLVYAAARSRKASLSEVDLAEWESTMRVNVTAPFLVLKALAARIGRAPAELDAVLVGALDRGQSLPLPPHFAASQGALSAMVMAVAHEVGRSGIRVNQLALGVLEGGLSRVLDASVIDEYLAFSALRRRGAAEEIARAVCWLALENTFMTGRVVPVNGGI